MQRFILLGILLCAGIVQAQNRNVIIQGAFTNAHNRDITLQTISNKPVLTRTIKNGNFSINASLNEGYYILSYGNNELTIYLVPGDVFTVKADGNRFFDTLLFYGVDPFRNNYLITKQRIIQKTLSNQKQFYSSNPDQFLQGVSDLYNRLLKLLNNSYALYAFKTIEAKAIQYEHLYRLQQYGNIRAYYFNTSAELPATFKRELSVLTYDNEQLYNTFPFYRSIVLSYWQQRIADAPTSLEMLSIYNGIYSKEIKAQLLPSFYQKMIETPQRAYNYYDLITSITADRRLLSAAQQKISVLDSVQPGMPSIPFSYATRMGLPVLSEELEGNYTLIDLWTCSCLPCLHEQEALDRIARDYPQISVVSISLDTENNIPRWKQIIANSYPLRIHLIADKSFESDFVKKYGVEALPRYILLDPDGIIITPYADKPSSAAFYRLLSAVLYPPEKE